ncbi:aspartate 1-decarboxylase precursor [Bacillus sp. NRRL B-14911]|uniref:Uncharacterized protein n=1 Tax=Bacillus infantis NRRL B-14911 TaxID=1367477 RepID=U5LD05_9BACI|nr:hypothetical protein N288_16880 [Bacillus infantis NRRL B-14911]EAR64573.1 aspartate 1-decarboxylase precursor [Bacillus sp. NRRL B-14911]OXT19342.1 hypothetical protein B9K06_02985 [Bacillus sp. OG2]PLR72408.1 hypothetical protein CYJ37_12730 [Bacillus sp. UMB0728]
MIIHYKEKGLHCKTAMQPFLQAAFSCPWDRILNKPRADGKKNNDGEGCLPFLFSAFVIPFE